VVDPKWEIEDYLELAAEHGVPALAAAQSG
jgi:hypothetical protein